MQEEYKYEKYTRAVKSKLLEECKGNGKFAPFIEFVKKSYDLELCFRGNSGYKYGMISIYRNNHTIWNLYIDNSDNKVISVSTDHCRFMSDWKEYAIKGLMELGFVPLKEELAKYSFEELDEKHLLAFATNKKDKGEMDADEEDKVKYNAIDLKFIINDSFDSHDINTLIEKSYIILCRMQEEFFHPLGHNTVVINETLRPINFLKKYVEKDANELEILSYMKPCVEKHVQQDIFTNNKKLRAGLFIYDLEFSQPAIEALGKVRNQPDMLAIRYNNKGEMAAIVLVEVKSTKSALKGDSGVRKHLEGMLSYLDIQSSAGKLIDHRKEEAYHIISQYKELGMYDLNEKIFNRDDFMKLPVEIMFAFSHGIDWDTNVTKTETVGSLIDDVIKSDSKHKINLSNYNYLKYGEQSRSISAYRIEVK